jgi:hypothetical protein
MQITTSLRRTAALAGLTAVAAAAPAAVSSAATYDNAHVIKPGATLPLDFAGYREPANKLVTVPKGFRIITLGIAGSEIGGRTENDYVGRRSVRLTLFADRNEVAAGQSADGTIYVLARRA